MYAEAGSWLVLIFEELSFHATPLELLRLNTSEFEDYRVLKGSKKEFHDIGSQVYSANTENRESLRKFLRTTNSFEFVFGW